MRKARNGGSVSVRASNSLACVQGEILVDAHWLGDKLWVSLSQVFGESSIVSLSFIFLWVHG